MNLPFSPYSKSQQTKSNRIKLTRKQRSELTPTEVKRLKERSNGVCERCDRQRATEKAHLERRWKSERRPTAEDFAHLCTSCHRWADQTGDGRQWLKQFRDRLIKYYGGSI